MKEQLNHLFLYIETTEEGEAAPYIECLKYLTLASSVMAVHWPGIDVRSGFSSSVNYAGQTA